MKLPNIRFYRNAGIGQRVTRNLRDLREALAERLATRPTEVGAAGEALENASIDRLAKSLVGIQLEDAQLTSLKIWLGLEGTNLPTSELPTVRDAAEAAAMPRANLQSLIETAVEKWSKNRWMTVLRDEVADCVLRREGIVTLDELASRMLGLHGCAASGEQRQRLVAAVLQAAVEAEVSRQGARYVWHRDAGAQLLLATEQLGSAFQSPPLERAAYTRKLAQRVTELAQLDPLPSAQQVDDDLAAILNPDDDEPLSAERRLRLAVAAAGTVALSSRLELYPKGMSAERALRLGSGALLGPKRLSAAQLQARIQSRFHHALPLPDRPELDELLQAAEIPLEWHPKQDGMQAGYAPPRRGTGLTRHSSSLHRSTYAADDDHSPEAQAAQRFDSTLRRAITEGRMLIVTTEPNTVSRAANALVQNFGFSRQSLDRLIIDTLQQVAASVGADWRVVLKADAAAQDTKDWRNLQALVMRAMPVIQKQLLEDTRPLLLEHPGLLLRYRQLGLLQILRDQAQRGGQPARILLLPGDPEATAPQLDGVALPIITAADATGVPRRWLQLQASIKTTDKANTA